MNSSKDEKKVNAPNKDAAKDKRTLAPKKDSSNDPKKGHTAPAHNKK